MKHSDAVSIVRERGGDELAERLEHLDATRASKPRDDDSPRAPDAGATTDYDVVMAGAGLSSLLALSLAQRGLRVALFDRGTAGSAHREWNASERELGALVSAGIFTDEELTSLVVAKYRDGFCRWHQGGTYRVSRVLDRAVDAGGLLSSVRTKCERAGVAVFDHHALVGHAAGASAIAMRFRARDGATREVTARLMIDARGAASPSATADLLCPTVGGVIEGIAEGGAPDEVDPQVGEILVTSEGIVDGRQHIWEAFPVGGRRTAVYLFYYDRVTRVGAGSLTALYARFFERLPSFKRGALTMVRPTFGFIPGWSRMTPAPMPPSPRVVLAGDAAARHSPLTFCGFGATLRSIAPASERIAHALSHRTEMALGTVVHDAAIHACTGALATMVAEAPRDPARAGELNALLDAAFATLHELGDDTFGALLRDEMSVRDFVRFLHQTSVRHPRVYRDVMRVMGAGGISRWSLGVAKGLFGASP